MISPLLLAIIAMGEGYPMGPPPAGPPTSGVASKYGGPPDKVRIDFTTGDANAHTQIFDNAGMTGNPLVALNPGISYWLSGVNWSPPATWYVRHMRNGTPSASISIAYGID